MRRLKAMVVVAVLASGRGCTCNAAPPEQPAPPACGALGAPCCALGCMNGGCDFGYGERPLACVRGVCREATADAGRADAADAGCASGLACEQCDVTLYSPPVMGSPVVSVDACTPAELAAYVAACFSATSTKATCAAWGGDGGACAACLAATPTSSASWGPLVAMSASTSETNTGGCVDLVLGTVSDEVGRGGVGSCGDAITTNDLVPTSPAGPATPASRRASLPPRATNALCTEPSPRRRAALARS